MRRTRSFTIGFIRHYAEESRAVKVKFDLLNNFIAFTIEIYIASTKEKNATRWEYGRT
jgi:hypothetical protein